MTISQQRETVTAAGDAGESSMIIAAALDTTRQVAQQRSAGPSQTQHLELAAQMWPPAARALVTNLASTDPTKHRRQLSQEVLSGRLR